MKRGFSTISTPQCGDRERNAGSGVEVVTYYTESVHLIYFSVFQSDYRRANRCSTWQLHEWLPLIAPRIGGIEWANNQRSPHLPPRRKIGEALRPPSEGKKPQNGLPIPENGQWIWQVRMEIGTRPSPFPLPNPIASPTNAAAAPPQQKRGQHREESSLLDESSPGAKRTQWKLLTMRAAGPLKSRLCVLHPQADHAQTVCIPARDIPWAGRNTLSVLRSTFALLSFIRCLRHVCFLVFSFLY